MEKEERRPLVPENSNTIWFVFKCATVASLGSVLLGYDIGVISGVLPLLEQQLELTETQTEIFAASLNFAAVIGALIAGPIGDRWGRRGPMILAAAAFGLGSILMGFAESFLVLCLGRVIHGLGIGVELMISPVYIAEISPPAWRGLLISLSEIAINIGIPAAFLCNYFMLGLGPDAWRWMFLIPVVPAFLLAGYLVVMPESPRWLLLHGQEEQAQKVVLSCCTSPAEGEAEIAALKKMLASQETSETLGLLEMLRRPVLKFGLAVAVLQQLCGIESFMYYIPATLLRAGFSPFSSANAGSVVQLGAFTTPHPFRIALISQAGAVGVTVWMGLIKLLFSLLGGWASDVLGRRPLIIGGFVGMGLCLCGLAISFILPPSTLASTLTLASIFGYVSAFAVSAGPQCWLLLGEMFPLKIRSSAMAICTASNRLASALVASTFLTLISTLGVAGTFGMYAVICVAGALYFHLRLPETKGMTLEQMEQMRFDGTDGVGGGASVAESK